MLRVLRSVEDCKAAAVWRVNSLCAEHGIIEPKITYGLRGADAGQAFMQQNRIDLNLVLFMENCDLKGFFAAIRSNYLPLVFEEAKSLTPLTLPVFEVWTQTLAGSQIGSKVLPEVDRSDNQRSNISD